jgi:ATP-dependent NAD(P)H-hydrate dehydratase
MPAEQDLLQAVRDLVPPLTPDRYKGQAGKIGTIGGCREYTGAPYFASISALKVGGDLSHVFCTEGAATVIKSYSPELIVHPYLPDSNGEDDQQRQEKEVSKAVGAIQHWLPRFDVMVIGPGLGRDPWVHAAVTEVIRTLRKDEKPVVIDADGLHILKHNLDLLKGWSTATLTPNHNEFLRLAEAVDVKVDEKDPTASLPEVVRKLDGPVVVQKGSADTISDGQQTIACTREGSPRRAGGQGDVLSGTLAAFKSWAVNNPESAEDAARKLGLRPDLLACWGACATVRQAAKVAFAEKRRGELAEDVISHLADAITDLYES